MFGIKKGDVITVTGAGGKTSLINYLASTLAKKGRVLIATTTKTYVPSVDQYENLIINHEIERGSNKNIDILGAIIKEGKVIGEKYSVIEEYSKEYDYALIEADGAKRKMIKEWNVDEPCIPPFANKNIGVINIEVLGKILNEESVHRYSEFRYKEKIMDERLFFKYLNEGEYHRGAKGEKYFFINGVEDTKSYLAASKVAMNIKGVYLGSLRDKWIERYKEISAVVMASGYSRRFGSNKLLATYKEKPIIEHLLILLKELPLKEVVVVGRDVSICDLARKYGYTYIENKKAHLGQSESVKLGVKNTRGDGMVFFTGDQPNLKRESVEKLMYEHQKNNGITRVMVDKKPSTPTIFPRALEEELLELEGDTGGREVIKNNKKLVRFIEFESNKEFKDIDTIEDLNSL